MPDQSLQSPWEQLPNEPDVWFDRFDRYAKSLGVEFTAKRAYLVYRMAQKDLQLESNALGLWSDMANRWQWAARAKAWASEERFLVTHKWRQRRTELLDMDWDMGKSLRDLAQKFIDTIEVHNEVGKDEEGNVLLEVTITPAQLATLARVSSELQRLGAGEPTEIHGTAAPGVGIYLPATDGAELEAP